MKCPVWPAFFLLFVLTLPVSFFRFSWSSSWSSSCSSWFCQPLIKLIQVVHCFLIVLWSWSKKRGCIKCIDIQKRRSANSAPTNYAKELLRNVMPLFLRWLTEVHAPLVSCTTQDGLKRRVYRHVLWSVQDLYHKHGTKRRF